MHRRTLYKPGNMKPRETSIETHKALSEDGQQTQYARHQYCISTEEELEESRSFADCLAGIDAKLSLYSSKHTMILVFALSNIVAFFFEAVPEYRRRGEDTLLAWFIGAARGCGNVLNLNFALIILLGARYTLTLLRSTPLSVIVPFDQIMPGFHMIVASVSFVFAVLHCIFHLVPGFIRGSWASGFGKWTYSFITGVLLLLVCVTVAFSSRKSKRIRSFETFYYIHEIGAVLIYALLILHGTHLNNLQTWKWVLSPLTIYIADRIIRKYKERRGTFNLQREDCHMDFKRGNILRLAVPKPFEFRAGQYAEIKVMALSKIQWHPFTIASAPHEPEMVFFIKASGDWTKRFYDLVRVTSITLESAFQSNLEVRIRGPYGSCSEHVGQHERVVLIGGGVGSTPFCSISKDAYFRISYGHKAQRCSPGARGGHADGPSKNAEVREEPQYLPWNAVSTLDDGQLELPFEDAGRTALFVQKRSRSVAYNVKKSTSFWSDFTRVSKISGSEGIRSYLLSSLKTVTLNILMLWTLLVRLGFLLTFVAFHRLDSKAEEVEAYISFLGTLIDLCVATLFAVPVSTVILMECFLWKANIIDVLILLPLSIAPVLIDGYSLAGTIKSFGKMAEHNLFILLPCLILVFLVRYFRILGSKILLAQRVSNSYTNTRSIDFIWTSPTREDDSWLVEELWPICSSDIVRIHRFITREPRDPEMQSEIVSNSKGRQDFVTHYGRPDFDELFASLAHNVRSGSTVGIFFCGPPSMSAQVRASAVAAMIELRTTEEQRLTSEKLERSDETSQVTADGQPRRRKVRRNKTDKWWLTQNVRFVFREENFTSL